MRLHELMENIGIQYKYISYDDMYGDDDDSDSMDNDELEKQARDLLKRNNVGALRGDDLTIVALSGNVVVGAMFQSFSGEQMSWTVVVDSDNRGAGIAAKLYQMMDIPENIETIKAELISPYTLESFVKKLGYEHIETSMGIKIYVKRVG